MKEPAFQLFPDPSQKGSGSVEVLQGQGLEVWRLYGLDPLGPGQVGSGGTQPLQGHSKAGPFQGEGEFVVLGQRHQQIRQALILPKASKHQGRPQDLAVRAASPEVRTASTTGGKEHRVRPQPSTFGPDQGP